METWRMYFLVGLGGGLGSVLRFWIAGVFARWVGEAFPWGTIFVNVTGSFVIGFLFTLTAADGRFMWPETTRNLFMAGICGGYTTFSAFSLQTLRLVHEREWLNVGLNVFGSVLPASLRCGWDTRWACCSAAHVDDSFLSFPCLIPAWRGVRSFQLDMGNSHRSMDDAM